MTFLGPVGNHFEVGTWVWSTDYGRGMIVREMINEVEIDWEKPFLKGSLMTRFSHEKGFVSGLERIESPL